MSAIGGSASSTRHHIALPKSIIFQRQLHAEMATNIPSDKRDTVLSLLCDPELWHWDSDASCSISFNGNGTGLVSLRLQLRDAVLFAIPAADHTAATRWS